MAFGLLGGGCLIYVVLSYSLAFGRSGKDRPAHLLWAALRELGATLMVMPFYPLWWVLGASYRARCEGEGDAGPRRNPVVLLHGFAMNQTSWLWMGRRLAARGIGPLYGFTYWTPQTVRRSAEALAHFVEKVRRREASARVDIVAHSLGGVVARYFIERLDGGAKVGRLITIGSPHRGTRLGRFNAGLPAARQLRADSSLFEELGPVREGVAYTSVWSRADAVVVPAESASIAPAGEDLVFDDLGHLSLLLSLRVTDAVAARLGAQP